MDGLAAVREGTRQLPDRTGKPRLEKSTAKRNQQLTNRDDAAERGQDLRRLTVYA